jgi:hypothetical protein
VGGRGIPRPVRLALSTRAAAERGAIAS